MNFKKLIAKDFLTYSELNYDFKNTPLIIQGINLTDDNQKSIGSGKSAFQTMIEFAITGDNSRGVKDRELVMFGKKSAFLELFIDCDVRKEQLHIKWNIKVKGSNVLEIKLSKKDVWQDVTFSNVADGKKWILNWISISKDDLFNYFIINKNRFKSFFKNSNKEKVELINRFSDASIINGIENVSTSELDTIYNRFKELILKSEGKLSFLEETLSKELKIDFSAEYKAKVLEINEKISEYEKYITELNEEIEDVNKSIINQSANKSKLQQKLDKLALSRLDLLGVIDNYNKEISILETQCKEAELKVDKFKGEDFAKLIEENKEKENLILDNVKSKENDILKLEVKENKIKKALNNIEIKLSGTIECPSCKHNFIKDGNTSLSKLRLDKARGENALNEIGVEIVSIKELINKLNLDLDVPKNEFLRIKKLQEKENIKKSSLIKEVQKIGLEINNKTHKANEIKTKINEIDGKITDIKDDLQEIKINKSDLIQEIKESESEIAIYKSNIVSNKNILSTLDKGTNKSDIDILKKQIRLLKSSILTNKKELEKIESDIFKTNEWKNNFKQFKNHIANKSLEIMEYNANRYLKGMGSDLVIRYDGYKTLANGTTKDEISAIIIRDAYERSFGSFSGGERANLIFASILSNRYMINKTHPYGGLNYLSIDEVFESLGSYEFRKLFDEIKSIGGCMHVITHVNFDNAGEDIITVVKENKISNILTN